MCNKDPGLEVAMGKMLRIGVTIAGLIVLAGGLCSLSQTGPVTDYRHFHGASAVDWDPGLILAGVFHFDGDSLIECGILLLIATPVCRVTLGVFGFLLMRDRLYAAVSAIVLMVLLLSFFTRI